MERILVTGGCGFIGSNFIRFILAERDWEVVNLDALTYAGNAENLADIQEDRRYEFVHGRVEDQDLAADLCRRVEAVVHFAAETHVDRSILAAAPFVTSNVQGTQILLDAARKSGAVRRFVHVSTDEVYGSLEPEDPPFLESGPLLPNSPYAASKAASDLMVRAAWKTYGFPAIITRCSNNYGPYQFPEKLIPLMIISALADRPLPVYGDGRNVRDWIHVLDHCAGLLAVLERGRDGEVYNLGGECEQTNLAVVRMILRALDKPDSLIRFVEDRPGHDRRYAMDVSKVRRVTGWGPATPFEKGLGETVAWYASHRPWWERVMSGAYRRYFDSNYRARLRCSP